MISSKAHREIGSPTLRTPKRSCTALVMSEVLNVLALLNLLMQKKIADFSKLPFMPKGILDYLNSIRESDASWCAAETAISNLETEHGITIKGSRDPQYRNQLLCQFNSFEYRCHQPPPPPFPPPLQVSSHWEDFWSYNTITSRKQTYIV